VKGRFHVMRVRECKKKDQPLLDGGIGEKGNPVGVHVSGIRNDPLRMLIWTIWLKINPS